MLIKGDKSRIKWNFELIVCKILSINKSIIVLHLITELEYQSSCSLLAAQFMRISTHISIAQEKLGEVEGAGGARKNDWGNEHRETESGAGCRKNHTRWSSKLN